MVFAPVEFIFRDFRVNKLLPTGKTAKIPVNSLINPWKFIIRIESRSNERNCDLLRPSRYRSVHDF